MPHPDEEFIRCGVSEIDRMMRGLKKGFVTLVSGLRASGKSSIISQITLECRQQGYRVALFSGELTATNLLKWLVLQAAGHNNTQQTQYEGFYNPAEGITEAVSKWLNDFVWVYNNNYGNDFEFVISKLQECTAEHKVDLVILDNLMALNIAGLQGYDKYDKQSNFVDYLERFAKKNNIHILFVAHPRKSNGFLRLEDVSGSNDLVNRVDNAFIIHRVNDDFKRLTRQDLHWKAENPLYQANNVIEICKDRDGGKQDIFIPLYFEESTKRLMNTPDEYKHYGWENDTPTSKFTELSDLEDIPF
jgi:KaiC/GvpD/RAD55 family RecA-like ATPase